MGKWHAYYARRCGAAVCAVADPQLPETELRRRFPTAAPFTALDVAVAKLRPDVVHVCAPAAAHENLIEQCLNARVHLVVEKPLVATAATTERLVRKAAECGVLLNPVHQYVFQDGFLKTVRSLGKLGSPVHFDAVVCSAGGTHMMPEQLDELVSDILPHPLSALDVLFPGILAGMDWTAVRSSPGEWRILGDAGRLTTSILVSLHGRPTESSLRLIATEGTMYVDFFHGFAFSQPGHVSPQQKISKPFSHAARSLWCAGRNLTSRAIRREVAYPGLRRFFEQFYRAVRLGSDPPLSADHVIAVARTRDQIRARVVRSPVR